MLCNQSSPAHSGCFETQRNICELQLVGQTSAVPIRTSRLYQRLYGFEDTGPPLEKQDMRFILACFHMNHKHVSVECVLLQHGARQRRLLRLACIRTVLKP